MPKSNKKSNHKKKFIYFIKSILIINHNRSIIIYHKNLNNHKIIKILQPNTIPCANGKSFP